MQVRPEQIDAHLAKSLAPIYLVYGDEPLLVQEVCDAIRAAARVQGYADREVMNVEAGFDWYRLTESSNNLSLFAERRILEVRMPTGKPGDAGGKALRAYAERPAEDTLLLVISGKLDAAQRKSKWVTDLESAGVGVPVWPVEARQLPAWIRQRLRARGLSVTPAAAQLLAERVEGNLLAAAQEVDKLQLLHGKGELDEDAVTAAVADSARFDVFQWVDALLEGKSARVVRMLQGLRGEGVEPVLILWALAREVRNLAQMARAHADGAAVPAVLARFRVWDKRKPMVGAALQRVPARDWTAALRRCARIDRQIKGAEPGNPWDELLQLALALCGQRGLAMARPA